MTISAIDRSLLLPFASGIDFYTIIHHFKVATFIIVATVFWPMGDHFSQVPLYWNLICQ